MRRARDKDRGKARVADRLKSDDRQLLRKSGENSADVFPLFSLYVVEVENIGKSQKKERRRQ